MTAELQIEEILLEASAFFIRDKVTEYALNLFKSPNNNKPLLECYETAFELFMTPKK